MTIWEWGISARKVPQKVQPADAAWPDMEHLEDLSDKYGNLRHDVVVYILHVCRGLNVGTIAYWRQHETPVEVNVPRESVAQAKVVLEQRSKELETEFSVLPSNVFIIIEDVATPLVAHREEGCGNFVGASAAKPSGTLGA